MTTTTKEPRVLCVWCLPIRECEAVPGFTVCRLCLDNAVERVESITEDRRAQRTDANAIQHGGTHYKDKAIEPWDYAVANNLDFLEGSIVKYVTRHRDKNGLEDLKKARHYIDKLIEVESAKPVKA